MKHALTIMSLLRGTLTVVVGFYATVCAAAYAMQRMLLFPAPTKLRYPSLVARRVALPESGSYYLRYDAQDGGGPESRAKTPIVVHFHGNGEQVGNLDGLSRTLSEMGLASCMVEYPGYPGTDGSVSEQNILRAAQEALVNLQIVHGVPASNIILMGQSIGTGVAMAMAARGWGSKLVLISPYTSIVDVAKSFTAASVLPVSLLLKDRFDSLALAPKVQIPVLIVHGVHDQLIPQSMGLALAEALNDVKFVSVPTGHNDIWYHAHVNESIRNFIKA